MAVMSRGWDPPIPVFTKVHSQEKWIAYVKCRALCKNLSVCSKVKAHHIHYFHLHCYYINHRHSYKMPYFHTVSSTYLCVLTFLHTTAILLRRNSFVCTRQQFKYFIWRWFGTKPHNLYFVVVTIYFPPMILW